MKKAFLLFTLSFILVNLNAQLTYKHVTVEYDSGWTYKNLQLIPVRYVNEKITEQRVPKNFITLGEGMKKGKVQVHEMFFNGDADVHVLMVKNNSKQNLLINSGELLKGGKQDRVIAETKIIPPGMEEQYLSTYCVEQGRWDAKPKTFKYAGTADATIREAVEGNREQKNVWKAIENQYKDSNKTYGLKSYLDLHKTSKEDSTYINYFTKQFAASDSSYAGFIAVSGDKIIGSNIFIQKELTNASFNNLLSSYVGAVDKKGKKPDVSYQAIKTFADELLANEEEQQKFLAKHGKAFYFEKQLIQIAAYGK